MSEMPASAGSQLSALRIQRELTLEAVAAKLHFTLRQLQALEEGRYDALPDLTFTRAMIRSYARFLEADAGPVLAALEAERPDAAVVNMTAAAKVVLPSQNIAFDNISRAGNRRFLVAALVLVLAALAIAVWEWQNRQPGSSVAVADPAPTNVTPTPAAAVAPATADSSATPASAPVPPQPLAVPAASPAAAPGITPVADPIAKPNAAHE